MSGAIVLAGDAILDIRSGSSVFAAAASDRYLRGYHTHAGYGAAADRVEGEAMGQPSKGLPPAIYAAVSGVVHLTECVVSVAPTNPRYVPEVGDVVVGRIIDISGARWRCEVFGMRDAVMTVSNVTDSSGTLRRRGREDELAMRDIFKEDDVFIAEVQRLNANDGGISLHTRSADKYGKRAGLGTLVEVRPALVPRVRRQFHVLVDRGPVGPLSLSRDAAASSESAGHDVGVSIVFGVNGGIWISVATSEQVRLRRLELQAEEEMARSGTTTTTSAAANSAPAAEDKDGASADTPANAEQDPVLRAHYHRCLALVANCVRVLNHRGQPITPHTVEAALACAFQNSWSAFDLVRAGSHGGAADTLINYIASTAEAAAAASADGVSILGGKRARMS